MRKAAWGLLLLLAFSIPWEFSLDLGEPLGNVSRIAGLLLLLTAIPAVLQAGRLRTPCALQWVVMAFFLWFCCSYFWTIEPAATLIKMRAYFQEMMIVWLVWEFAESPRDLRWLLRAYVAGSWVLAALTLANLGSPEAIATGQTRFVAYGQDPNDVARFLDMGFPLAALLWNSRASPAGTAAGDGLPAAGPGCGDPDGLARRVPGGDGGACGLRDSSLSQPREDGACRGVFIAGAGCRNLDHRASSDTPTPDHDSRADSERRFKRAARDLVCGLARIFQSAAAGNRGGFVCERLGIVSD